MPAKWLLQSILSSGLYWGLFAILSMWKFYAFQEGVKIVKFQQRLAKRAEHNGN